MGVFGVVFGSWLREICDWLDVPRVSFITTEVLNKSTQKLEVELPEDVQMTLKDYQKEFVKKFGLGKDWKF